MSMCDASVGASLCTLYQYDGTSNCLKNCSELTAMNCKNDLYLNICVLTLLDETGGQKMRRELPPHVASFLLIL